MLIYWIRFIYITWLVSPYAITQVMPFIPQKADNEMLLLKRLPRVLIYIYIYIYIYKDLKIIDCHYGSNGRHKGHISPANYVPIDIHARTKRLSVRKKTEWKNMTHGQILLVMFLCHVHLVIMLISYQIVYYRWFRCFDAYLWTLCSRLLLCAIFFRYLLCRRFSVYSLISTGLNFAASQWWNFSVFGISGLFFCNCAFDLGVRVDLVKE